MNNLTTSADQNSGSKSDGSPDFIDFYQLLSADAEATTTALRRKINDLYTEAQSNRDHRNPAKRRRYEALCDLLPYCRIVLLDPDKRARYDRYREQHEAGEKVPDLEAMMDEIAGRVDDSLSGANGEKIGLLAVKGDDDYLPLAPQVAALEEPVAQRKGLFNKPSARPVATVATTETTTTTREPAAPLRPSASATSSTRDEPTEREESRPRPSAGGLTPIGFGAIVFALATLTMLVFNMEWPKAMLIGIVAGVIAFAIGNALGNSSSRSRRNRVQ